VARRGRRAALALLIALGALAIPTTAAQAYVCNDVVDEFDRINLGPAWENVGSATMSIDDDTAWSFNYGDLNKGVIRSTTTTGLEACVDAKAAPQGLSYASIMVQYASRYDGTVFEVGTANDGTGLFRSLRYRRGPFGQGVSFDADALPPASAARLHVKVEGTTATFDFDTNFDDKPEFTQTVTGLPASDATGIAIGSQGQARLDRFAVPGITLRTAPTSLSFPTQLAGAASAVKTVTLTNPGPRAVTLSGIRIIGGNPYDFVRDGGTCSATAPLAAGASCTVGVKFTPGGGGDKSAVLRIEGTGGVGRSDIPVSGTGVVSKGSWSGLAPFADQRVGTTGASQTATLTSTGDAPLTLQGISITGNDPSSFVRTGGTCTDTAVLAPGATCTVTVALAPTKAGPASAELHVDSDAVSEVFNGDLAGRGLAPDVSISPPAGPLSFPDQRVGTAGADRQVVVGNPGSAMLALGTVVIDGADAGAFSRTGGSCGGELAPGASCTILVTFTPARAGAALARLAIPNDAADREIVLKGTGVVDAVAPVVPVVPGPSTPPGPVAPPQAPAVVPGRKPAGPAALVLDRQTGLPARGACLPRRRLTITARSSYARRILKAELRRATGRPLKLAPRGRRLTIDLRRQTAGPVRLVLRIQPKKGRARSVSLRLTVCPSD
jgi:hypothetical protein